MKPFTPFLLLLAAALLLAGCATPKATYEQGLFAGQAEARTLSLVERMEARGQHWQDQALSHKRAEASRIAAEQRALARQFRDPALIERYTWQAATDYFEDLSRIAAVERAENAAWAADREAGRVLAGAAIDISDMSAAADRARQEFQRTTATGVLRIGADAWATHQAEQARRRAEEARRDLERREAELADREAELEAHHHEPPSEGEDQ